MYYVFHVCITQGEDDNDGISMAGKCTSFFDATQKMYIDLWNCHLSGDIHGTMYFFEGDLPVPNVPMNVNIMDTDLCDELQNDEPREVEGCKKAGMRWMELAVDGEKVPPAIMLLTRKERALRRELLRSLPVIIPDEDGIARPGQVVAVNNGPIGGKDGWKIVNFAKQVQVESGKDEEAHAAV